MKKRIIVLAGTLIVGLAQAENLEGIDRMICAATQAKICIENDKCYTAAPAELHMPDFVVIDTEKKTVSTTKVSGQNRSTTFASVKKNDGLIYMQGIEGDRAFSFVIGEATGHMTVTVLSDGFSVSVFGVCTDSDI